MCRNERKAQITIARLHNEICRKSSITDDSTRKDNR